MRPRIIVSLAATAAGSVVAIAGVLATHWWTERHSGAGRALGFSAPRRYVDYLPSTSGGTDWAALLVPAAIAGAVLGLVAVLGWQLVRSRTARRPTG